MNILITILAALTITFWAYSNVWYQKGLLRYPHGFLAFTIIQWVLVLINLIWIWDWIVGLIAFAILMLGGAVIITNHTTNQIYRILKMTPDVGVTLFSIFVWLLAIATVIKIFV